LSLTGGLRYTWNKIDGVDETISYTLVPGAPGGPPLIFSRCSDSLRFGNVILPTDPAQCHKELTESSKAPTWTIDLDYKPTRDILLYAKYSRGYREGGLAFTSPGAETWRPEKVDAYEIGAKVSLHGPVSGYFNIAGFYNDFTDQQIFGALIAKPNSGQLGGLAVINAGKSRIEGIEVETSIIPVENFRIDLGYTYLKTKVIAILPVTLPANSPYASVLPTSNVGDPLTLSPKNRVTVTGTYTLPLSADVGKISLGATFTHTDKQVANGTELAVGGLLPPTDLLNLNLNWDSVMGQPLDLSVFATNVTNQIYAVNSSGSYAAFGFASIQIGQPRMVGVRARFRFGT
jgi:iron complex outermembrane receptor protein